MMLAIRQIRDVKDGAIMVMLPAGFYAKRVEIIILPIQESGETTSQDLKDLLLAAPTLADDELNEFETVREWMNQWNIQDF